MATRQVTPAKKSPQRGGHRLDITVWQFVRIMVQLEAVAKSRGGRRRAGQAPTPQDRPVYADWRAAWQEIDHQLTKLAADDADAFADLMMNQNVVLECRNRSQINEVARAIDNIVYQMRAEIVASAGDEGHITDLRFEIREIEKLAKKLSGIGRKKVKQMPAKPAQATPEEAKAAKAATKPASAKPSSVKPAGARPSGTKSAGARSTGARAGAPLRGKPTARPPAHKGGGAKPGGSRAGDTRSREDWQDDSRPGDKRRGDRPRNDDRSAGAGPDRQGGARGGERQGGSGKRPDNRGSGRPVSRTGAPRRGKPGPGQRGR